MKKLFISYELALKLKEKGFDEECLGTYRKGLLKWPVTGTFYIINSRLMSDITAPLYQQVVDWLDTKHSIFISVGYMKRSAEFYNGYYANLKGTNKKSLNEDNFITINNTSALGYDVFKDKYQALDAAITHALTLI